MSRFIIAFLFMSSIAQAQNYVCVPVQTQVIYYYYPTIPVIQQPQILPQNPVQQVIYLPSLSGGSLPVVMPQTYVCPVTGQLRVREIYK